MRLIDADAFDRDLASHEFSAALNEAASAGRITQAGAETAQQECREGGNNR